MPRWNGDHVGQSDFHGGLLGANVLGDLCFGLRQRHVSWLSGQVYWTKFRGTLQRLVPS